MRERILARFLMLFTCAFLTTSFGRGRAAEVRGSTQPVPLSVAAQNAAGSSRDDVVQELSSSWGANPTLNVNTELKEVGRQKISKGTAISYRLETSGFPAGKIYVFLLRQSGDRKVVPLWSGYQADAAGKLGCPAEPQSANAARVGSPCKPGTVLEEQILTIGNYHKGEPAEFGVVSTDGTVRAFARAYPFPIQAQDGPCTLTVELEEPTGSSFAIRGTGFVPNDNVKTSASFGKDSVEGTQQASPLGEFATAIRAELPGKNSGTAKFIASGASCHPSVSFDWGRAAMKLQ